jgi:hypothetical protein
VALLDERKAVHDGHHQVEDDRRWTACAQGLERFAAVGR